MANLLVKPWYQMSESEICAFFDVDMAQGLSKKDALARLAKFGDNADPILPEVLHKQLTAKVIRNYCIEPIIIKQIALGDVVLLEEGDRVPADIRLMRTTNLTISQSAITGEPIAIPKNTLALQQKAAYIEQKCIAFAGSFVTSGSGVGVVVARGQNTAIAKVPKKRVAKGGFRWQAVAKKLQYAGVVLLNARILKEFNNISAVVVDAKITNEQIVDIIRKIQLTKSISCKFLIDTDTANKLADDLGALVYDAKYPRADIIDAQFMVNTDAATSVKLVSSLQESGKIVLWITDGARSLVGSKSANIVLAIGEDGRDDFRLSADILAVKQDPTIITQIL